MFDLSQERGELLLKSVTNTGKKYQNARSTSCSGGPQTGLSSVTWYTSQVQAFCTSSPHSLTTILHH